MKIFKSCKKCLYTTKHPLGLDIDENGICSGCRIHEEKYILDWEERKQTLEKQLREYKSSSNNYDCIIPVSGSGDSYYIVHLVKNILKLNPLVVHYNHYFNTKVGIRNLSNLRITFDLDILFQNVNPISVRKITKTTLRKFGSIYWHVIAGQTAFPVQVAVTHKIPLIFWGAHQGIEQVGMFSHLDEVEMTRRYRKEHDLMGFEADDLLSFFDTLNEEDIWQYRYPGDSDHKNIGIRNVYLGNFFKWDPKAQYDYVIKKYNYSTTNHARSFFSYDHVDCFNYMNLHDLIKYIKHGYSKVTDHATREIRHKRLSRENAINLVHYYEREKPLYIKQFCEWLGINENGLYIILNKLDNKSKDNFVNYNFHLNKNNKKNYLKDLKSIFSNNFIFNEENNMNIGADDKYITFGKGFPF